MAIEKIEIVTVADTDKAVKEFDDLKKSIDNVDQSADEMNRGLSSVGATTKVAATDVKVLPKALKDTQKEMKATGVASKSFATTTVAGFQKTGQAVEGVTAALGKVTAAIGIAVLVFEGIKMLARWLADTDSQLERLTKTTDVFNKSLDRTSKIHEAQLGYLRASGKGEEDLINFEIQTAQIRIKIYTNRLAKLRQQREEQERITKEEEKQALILLGPFSNVWIKIKDQLTGIDEVQAKRAEEEQKILGILDEEIFKLATIRALANAPRDSSSSTPASGNIAARGPIGPNMESATALQLATTESEEMRKLLDGDIKYQIDGAKAIADGKVSASKWANKQMMLDDEKKHDFDEAMYAASIGLTASASKLVGEQTAAGKLLSIASATISTYQAANVALASAPPPANYALMAATIAAGLVNVANIVSTQVPGETSASSAGVQVPSMPTLMQPIQEVNTNMNPNDLDEINKPQRVYVLESDITSTQRKVSVVDSETTF